MSSARPKVVYWNNQPTPYVVARFNALADRGVLDFEAWFDGMREADRSWAVDPRDWRFASRVLPGRPAGRAPLPLAELRAFRPDVFITNYDRLTYLLGATASLALSGRTAVRTLPSFPSWESRSLAREAAKHLLFRAVDGAKVPGPDGRAYAERYGLSQQRSWTVTQSIDVDLYLRGRLDGATRGTVRDRLGLGGCVFVYVGRIWAGKGLSVLLAAYRQLRASHPSVRLLLVGDGPDQDRYRQETADLPDVIWHGFAQSDEVCALYGSCDVLVFPTLGDPNGLVIEEAMTAALPVITSDAAGDIHDRVPADVGQVVPAGDVGALADAMSAWADDPERRRRAGEAAQAIGERFRPERYAEDFERFVHGILSAPRRRTLAALGGRLTGRVILGLQTGRTGVPDEPVER